MIPIMIRKINYFSSEALIYYWLQYHFAILLVSLATKKVSGGMWVGGVCELHFDRLVIGSNSLNQKIHESLKQLEIKFGDIEGVLLEKKFTTDVIIIKFSGTEVRIRCWKAEKFMSNILLALQQFESHN